MLKVLVWSVAGCLGACPLVYVTPDWSGSVQGVHFRKLMLFGIQAGSWVGLLGMLGWFQLRLSCSGFQTCQGVLGRSTSCIDCGRLVGLVGLAELWSALNRPWVLVPLRF